MPVKLKSHARSSLAKAVTRFTTTLQVKAGDGVKFPELTSAGDWFPIALENTSGGIEYCRATARSGDAITVQRGAEGSLPMAFAAGDACELRYTRAALLERYATGSLPVASIGDAVLY